MLARDIYSLETARIWEMSGYCLAAPLDISKKSFIALEKDAFLQLMGKFHNSPLHLYSFLPLKIAPEEPICRRESLLNWKEAFLNTHALMLRGVTQCNYSRVRLEEVLTSKDRFYD